MRSKWLVAALAVSLILNLVAAGFILGRLTGGPRFVAPDPTAGFGRLLRFLPEDRREALAPTLRGHRAHVMRDARTLRARHRAVFDALAAEPYDPDTLVRALADLRATLNSTQESAHRSLAELAESLSPEERRALAEAMRHPPWRRDHPRTHHPGRAAD
jgi:uncharacterized membrane protein